MSVPSTMNAQPKFNWISSSVWYSLYYIVFMFVASLCTLQLFIGVSRTKKVVFLCPLIDLDDHIIGLFGNIQTKKWYLLFDQCAATVQGLATTTLFNKAFQKSRPPRRDTASHVLRSGH